MSKQLTEDDAINIITIPTDHGTELTIEVRPFFKDTQYFMNGDDKAPLFTPNDVKAMLYIGAIEHHKDIFDVIREHISKLWYGVDYITTSERDFRLAVLDVNDKLSNLTPPGSPGYFMDMPNFDTMTFLNGEKTMYFFTLLGVARLAEVEAESVRQKIKDRFDTLIPTIQDWYREYIAILDEKAKTLKDSPIPGLGFREGMQIKS